MTPVDLAVVIKQQEFCHANITLPPGELPKTPAELAKEIKDPDFKDQVGHELARAPCELTEGIKEVEFCCENITLPCNELPKTPAELEEEIKDPDFKDQDFWEGNILWTHPRYEWRFQDPYDENIVWDYHPKKPNWSFLFEYKPDGIVKRVIWDPEKKPTERRTKVLKQSDDRWRTEHNPLYYPYVTYDVTKCYNIDPK